MFFSNISPDSLTRLLRGKQIISLTLQSNTDFSYTKENKPESGKRAELEFVINPVFHFAQPTIIVKSDTINSRRKILQYDLAKEIARQNDLHYAKRLLTFQVKKLSDEIPAMELYEREKATKELAALNLELLNVKPIEDNAGKIRIQLQQLDIKTVEVPEVALINGYLNYFTL